MAQCKAEFPSSRRTTYYCMLEDGHPGAHTIEFTEEDVADAAEHIRSYELPQKRAR